MDNRPAIRKSQMPPIAFGLGEVVYLKIREEKIPGMVTGWIVRPASIAYQVSWANTGAETGHYAIELTTDYDPFRMADE